MADKAKNTVTDDKALLAAIDKTIKLFKDGDVIQGKVVNIARDEVLVDVNYKAEGVIPLKELSVSRNNKPEDVVTIGEKIDILVLDKEDKEGRLVLSKRRADAAKNWDKVEQSFNNKETIQGKIVEIVRGGAIVDIGIRAFLPASLVDDVRVRDVTPYLGQSMEFRIADFDRKRSNIVVDHKSIAREANKKVREELLTQIEVGQIRKGKVSTVVDYGVFVDLGNGVDGLVRNKELSWDFVANPADLFKEGQTVSVEITDIEDGKINLSIKATQEDPWQEYARNHVIGQIVEGKVSDFTKFGAFIDVAPRINGLVHISEISAKHIAEPSDLLSKGETVFVKIMDIDLDGHRISFSIKKANFDLDNEIFDPVLYQKSNYDEKGNIVTPEGFDDAKQEWKKGFEAQQKEWTDEYLAAEKIWTQHKKFVEEYMVKEDGIKDSGSPRGGNSGPRAAKTPAAPVEKIHTNLEDNSALADLKASLEG
jgi:small subunit ribosomal protein S1